MKVHNLVEGSPDVRGKLLRVTYPQDPKTPSFMPKTFTTAAVPPSQRVDYWRDAVCDVFIHLDISEAGEKSGDFDGSIIQHSEGHLNLAEVLADGHEALRSPRQVSKASEDCFLVLIQRLGETWIEQDGRGTWIRQGEFAICDSSRPYQMHLPNRFHHQVLKIPGRVLRDSTGSPERFTARAVSTDKTAGRLFLGMINMLGESTADLSSREAAGVADSLVDLLGAAIGSLDTASMPLPRNIESYHRERIKDLVRARMFDADLTVEAISAGVNLSLRYVHALFASEPMTLSAWIWHERLEAGRRALLADASDLRPVTDIALSVGFKDLAHFSRLFKSTYGVSPREFRRSVSESEGL